ncbi:RidA family protein [Glaciihabitans sp. dw_435]|uniref:RidA family protein n=1 Tax=Glaciihabitans sp. dw_435 TaxID=2720081 RepID=UPI001BD3A59E|nr:Rid family hydrolase [Glaciihabitans sp. dw_435]
MSAAVSLITASLLSSHAGYSHAAVVASGTRLVFLAGSCPVDLDGSTVAVGDVAGQARACIDNMAIALQAAGATISDVVSTRILVASRDREDLVLAWDIVRAAFGDHAVPSTLLGVTVLGYPDQLVEVEAVAAISVDSTLGS